MDVRETEEDILADLHELDDPVLQYAYLVACAGEAEPYPDSLRDDEHLVRECQVKTWIDARHHADGAVRLVGEPREGPPARSSTSEADRMRYEQPPKPFERQNEEEPCQNLVSM